MGTFLSVFFMPIAFLVALVVGLWLLNLISK